SGVDLPGTSAQFDITVQFHESGDELAGLLIYNTDLFDVATIERLAGNLLVLFDGIAASPDAPISQLPILTAAERDQLLTQWNDTARAVPAATLPELFAAQAARTPDAV